MTVCLQPLGVPLYKDVCLQPLGVPLYKDAVIGIIFKKQDGLTTASSVEWIFLYLKDSLYIQVGPSSKRMIKNPDLVLF